MLHDLAGKTAFVTGGASGIGLAMGRAFAKAGMRVMLADIEPKPLQQALEALQGNLPEVRGVLCDVRDYDRAPYAGSGARFPRKSSEGHRGGID